MCVFEVGVILTLGLLCSLGFVVVCYVCCGLLVVDCDVGVMCF